MQIPDWLQWVIWAGAGVVAFAAIWSKLLRPMTRLVSYTEQLVPLLSDLTVQFRDSPQSFHILKEIIAQFRSDSGSSLRDVVDRLDKAATDSRVAAEALKVKAEVLEVNVAAVKELAIGDRAQAARLEVALDLLTAKFARGEQIHG